MADGSLPGVGSLKGKVSEAEWKARVDLAALYRLVALHGWDDMIFTHISARIPGPEHHFLINPYGMFFGEMTASALVKIDLDGNIIQETPYFINPAGFTIHSAIHAAREDAQQLRADLERETPGHIRAAAVYEPGDEPNGAPQQDRKKDFQLHKTDPEKVIRSVLSYGKQTHYSTHGGSEQGFCSCPDAKNEEARDDPRSFVYG